MKFSKLFITGCDKNTEWMLPWFIDNFTKNNDCPLMIFDFGMSPEVAQRVDAVKVKGQDVGWFKKPKAMIQATKHATNICWLDTDCHVQANIADIFDYVESNKIAMVEDAPWSKRRGEKWHNSGVVAFHDRPNILDEWATAVAANPQVGDQEVLHSLVKGGMRRMIHITDLPRKYNTLRLDIDDGTAPSDTAVMHWTGHKGKDIIRKMMQ
jgi:hypothetical protein